MKSYLDSLIPLAAQPHLVPAEQIITLALIPFENIFLAEQKSKNESSNQTNNNEVDEDELLLIEQVILPFFNVNDGILSLPCSIRIASCLIFVYERSNCPEKWNSLSYLSLKLTPASICGIGQIIDFVGDRIESRIPGIAKNLLKNYNSICGSNFFSKKTDVSDSVVLSTVISTLFALNSCIKRSPNLIHPFFNTIFNIAKSASLSDSEPMQLSGLKLLRTLVKKYNDLPISTFLNVATQIFKSIDDDIVVSTNVHWNSEKNIVGNLESDNFYISIGSQSHYVYIDACYFVARLAYEPFLSFEPEEQRKEWTTPTPQDESTDSKNELKESFEIMKQFKQHFKVILSRFLDLLEPQTVHKNLFALYEFVREVNEQELPQVMSLFGNDVKSVIFKRVACEQPPTKEQLELLKSLYFGVDSTREIAALAMQLANSGNWPSTRAASEFFAELDEWDPDLAQQYIDTAMLCLAYPPEDQTQELLDNKISGFATIASSILGTSPDRIELSFDNADKIDLFLNRFLKCQDVLDPKFEACFILMTVLPEKLIPKELTSEALARFAGFIEGPDYINQAARANEVCRNVSFFLAQHPYFEVIGRLFWHMISLPNLPSRSANLAIVVSAPYALKGTSKLANISYMLVEHILSVRPSNDLIFSMLKHPIRTSNFEAPIPDLFFSYVPKNEFAYYIIQNYPDFILGLKPEAATKTISKLMMSRTNLCMSHLLLLSLIMNDKVPNTLLPKGFNKSLFDTLNDESDIMRLFITAEILAIHAKNSPKRIQAVLKVIDSFQSQTNDSHIIVKCVLLAALFSHVSIDSEILANLMHDLDGIAMMSEEYTIFALHALSVLFIENDIKLQATGLVEIQAQVLFNILNSSHVLYPEELEMVAIAFSNYLPIVSPELETEKSRLIHFIQIIVQSFMNIPLPFARHFTFRTMQCVSTFSPKLASNFNKMEFPTAIGISTNLQLIASAAFADLLRVSSGQISSECDYFEYLDDSLVNLQRTGDSRARDFIIAIAQHFADHFDLNSDIETVIKIQPQIIENNTTISIENNIATDQETEMKVGATTNELQRMSIENENNNEADENTDDKTKNYGMQRFADWIYVIKTILANSALPFTGDALIEATRKVKLCALDLIPIFLSLLEKLDTRKNFRVDFLTDIMTSVIRAIETRKKSLASKAYQILTSIIDMFKDKLLTTYTKTETVTSNDNDDAVEPIDVDSDKNMLQIHVLSLYDAQLSTAVRYGFQIDLSISGEFLVSFLWFHLDNLKTHLSVMKVILDSYVSGIEKCKQRTIQLVGIAAAIADVAREHPVLFDQVKTFVTKEMPLFADVIKESMELFGYNRFKQRQSTEENKLEAMIDEEMLSQPDWQKIATFRSNYSEFYGDLLSSFVWFQKKLNMESKFDLEMTDILQFCINEIESSNIRRRIFHSLSEEKLNETSNDNSSIILESFQNNTNIVVESWRVSSAFEALAVFIQIYPEKVSMDVLEHAVDVVRQMHEASPEFLEYALPLFLRASVEKITEDVHPRIWGHLMEAALNLSYVPEVLGVLLKKGKKTEIVKYAHNVFRDALELPNDMYLAVLTILIHAVPEKAISFVEELMHVDDEKPPSPLIPSVNNETSPPSNNTENTNNATPQPDDNSETSQPKTNSENENKNKNDGTGENVAIISKTSNEILTNILDSRYANTHFDFDEENNSNNTQKEVSKEPKLNISDIWKLKALNILLRKIDDPDLLTIETQVKIAKLIWMHFKRGGMKVLSALVPISHRMSYRILSFGSLKFIQTMIEKEYENVNVYLKFLLLCFDELKDEFLTNSSNPLIQKDPEEETQNEGGQTLRKNLSINHFATNNFTMFANLIKIGFVTISTYGSPDPRVIKMMTLSANLLNKAREANPTMFKEVVMSLIGQREMQVSMALMEKAVINKQKKIKGMKLKNFSETARKDINDIENEDGVPLSNEISDISIDCY